MDAAIKFYGRIGFPVLGRKLYPQYVELDHDDEDRFHLILAKVERPVTDPYPTGSQTLINVHVSDLLQRMQELDRHGIKSIHGSPQQFPDGIYAAYKDPSDNFVELVEFHPQKGHQQSKQNSKRADPPPSNASGRYQIKISLAETRMDVK